MGKVTQTFFLEPFHGRALHGWALSSWPHLGLFGAISLKEQVIVVATVIETDPAQLCVPDKLFFLPAQSALLIGKCRQHAAKAVWFRADTRGTALEAGRAGTPVGPWDLTFIPAKT